MVHYFLLLITLPLSFQLTTTQSSEGLYVVENDTSKELICISEDSKATLIWNHDLSTNKSSGNFEDLGKTKPTTQKDTECAIWRSNDCAVSWKEMVHWNVTDSVTEPMTPVIDYRWKDFQEYDLKAVMKDGKYQSAMNLSNSSDGTSVFSIRGTRDIEIRLCNNDDLGTSSYVVIKIAVKGTRSVIENCLDEQPCDRRYAKLQNCSEKANVTHEAAILEAFEWRTFRLQWIGDKNMIKLFNDTDKNAFLQGRVKPWHSVSEILVKSYAAARFKFHNYNYSLATIPNAVLTTREFDHHETNFCFHMLVSLCRKCQLNVTLTESKNGKVVADTTIFGHKDASLNGLRTWRSFKRNWTLRSPFSGSLQIISIPNEDNNTNTWWAIDKLRFCEQDDGSTSKVQESTTTSDGALKIKCQKLVHSKIVVADLTTCKPFDDINTLRQFIRERTMPRSNFSGVQCNSNGRSCYRGFRKDDGKSCFSFVLGIKNITLVKHSNSEICECLTKNINLTVYAATEVVGSQNQFCSVLPCRYKADLKPFTEYRVEVTFGDDPVILNKTVKTLEAVFIPELNLTSAFPYNLTGEWNAPFPENIRIRNYTVTIQRINFIGCNNYNISSPAGNEIEKTVTETRASFTNLDPYSEYNFTVVANHVETRLTWTWNRVFETQQLEIPTTKVSNLRIIYGKSHIAWDGPDNCTLITGPTDIVKLDLVGVDDWVRNWKYTIETACEKYNLKGVEFKPYTKYKVRAYIIRDIGKPVNESNYEELYWTTAPAAPPAVHDLEPYDFDIENKTISIKWEPPSPANGVIESYRVVMTIGKVVDKDEIIKTSNGTGNCTLSPNHVCLENWHLPANITPNTEIMFRVIARNENVDADGQDKSLSFSIDDLNKKELRQPQNLVVNLKDHGIVTLEWKHPLFNPIKIIRFHIEVEFHRTDLLIEPLEKNQSIEYFIIDKRAMYRKELFLSTSTEYSVYINAVDYRNRTSNKTIHCFSVLKSIGFAEKKLEIEEKERMITLQIPPVSNGTTDTKISIITKGLMECKQESSRNLTTPTDDILLLKQQVNDSKPMNYTFESNQYYGVEQKCSFRQTETYKFEVRLSDLNRTYDFLKSGLVNFNKKKLPREIKEIWLVLISIPVMCILLLVIWIRKHRRVQSDRCDSISLSLMGDRGSLADWVDTSVIQRSSPPLVTRKDRLASIERMQTHFYPVNIKEFEDYVKEALASRLLESQYEMLPKIYPKHCDYGYLPENRSKNRFDHIIPYDENRIILEKIPNKPYSDYINASYIRGRQKAKAYIATQGPMRDIEKKTNTVPDFWRMVWQEEVEVICMLTNVIEDGQRKCEQYWPDIGKRMKLGNAVISNIDHELFTDYTIRTLQLKCRDGERLIKHFHYTRWPDHGIPMYTQSLVAILKKLLKTPAGKGPVVVHSSAGVGRTGSFILCDINLRQAIKERIINIPAVTQRIRQNRGYMIENVQQYVLAHLVLAECLIIQRTEIPCDNEFKEKINELRKQLPSDVKRLRKMVWQDKELHSLATRPPIVDDATPNRPWDQTDFGPAELSLPPPGPKNWDGCFRVLSVAGIQREEQYMATRLPSNSTLFDFWSLVIGQKIELIVVLQPPNVENTMNMKDTHCDIVPDKSDFLPSINIRVSNTPTLGDEEYFKSQKLLLTNNSQDEGSTQPLTILTCTAWGNETDGTPPPPAALVSLWIASEKVKRKESPTLVVCRDGVTGCGLYLALSVLLNRMSLEKQCDIISAVRTVRRSDSEFVQSLEQFEYLYDSALNYYELFKTYAN